MVNGGNGSSVLWWPIEYASIVARVSKYRRCLSLINSESQHHIVRLFDIIERQNVSYQNF